MTRTDLEIQDLVDKRIKHKLANEKTIINFEFDSMRKDIESIKEVTTELKELMKEGFFDIKENYTTKSEHQRNKESIDRLWKIVWGVIGFVFIWLGGIITAAIMFYIKAS